MKGRAYMASVTRDLTEGKPMKLILSFGIPLLFGFLFQQFYNVADTAIVGRFLGGDALAAVGSTGSAAASEYPFPRCSAQGTTSS